MGGLDRSIFWAINGWSDGLDSVLTAFSKANTWPGFKVAMLGIVVLLIVLKRGRAALLALVAFPIADGVCNLLKHVFPMHRPFQAMEGVVVRVGRTDSMGTASSHAANLAAVATVMTLALGWRWGLPWIAAAFLTGLSRVYVGAHYPSQVLLGWGVGVLIGVLVARTARWIGDLRTKRAEPAQP